LTFMHIWLVYLHPKPVQRQILKPDQISNQLVDFKFQSYQISNQKVWCLRDDFSNQLFDQILTKSEKIDIQKNEFQSFERVYILELNENKCLAVLRAKVQWKFVAGQTKADKLIKFAYGHSLVSSLPLVKFYYLTRVPL
jgi:hypothetical protein